MKKKTKKQPVHLLIDADVLAYQASASVEKVVCFDEDLCLPIASLDEALVSFDNRVQEVCELLGTDDYVLCFSDSHENNFRKKINPDYKSNRKGKPRPVSLYFLRDKIINDVYKDKVKLYPSLEGDDVLGVLVTNEGYKPECKKIIVSIDKDMKTLPALFFDMGHPVDEEGNIIIKEQDEETAMRYFYQQVLTGDTTDGYKGCPKYGEITATKFLDKVYAETENETQRMTEEDKHKHIWQSIVEEYEKAGLTEDYALLMARMAHILHTEDYNLKTKKVKLWRP